MIRMFIRLLIFVLAIGLSLYIGVQWKLSEDLKYLSKQLKPFVTFEYQNSMLTLDGRIVLDEINLFFPTDNLNVTVSKIEYSSGSIFDMAFFSRQVKDVDLANQITLTINEAVIPLTPALVKFIASAEQGSSWNALNAVACGKNTHLGINEYFSMGYDYIVFSSYFNFYRDDYNGNLMGGGWLDVEDSTKTTFQLSLSGLYEQLAAKTSKNTTHIELLDLTIKDKGYNQHRNEFCGLKSNTDPQQYVQQHIQEVVQKLKSVDIDFPLSSQRLYAESMQPSSRIHIRTEPQVDFSFKDFGYYNEAEIRKRLKLKLEVNGKKVSNIFNHWSLKKFNEIVFSNKDDDRVKRINQAYKNIVIKRKFIKKKISSAKNHINEKVKILRHDGKIIQGILTEIEGDRLYIERRIERGFIKVSIEKKAMASFYVYL